MVGPRKRRVFRFSLTTLLLSTVIVALCIGWFLSMASMQKRMQHAQLKHDEEIESMWLGIGTLQDIECLMSVRRASELGSESEFNAWVDHELAFGMWKLWQHEKSVNGLEMDTAASLGGDILVLLKCDTADAFLTLARSHSFDVEGFPEIHDSKSAEHISLRGFVMRAAKELQ